MAEVPGNGQARSRTLCPATGAPRSFTPAATPRAIPTGNTAADRPDQGLRGTRVRVTGVAGEPVHGDLP